MGRADVDGNAGAGAEDIVVRLQPVHWRTSDFSKLELPTS